MRLFLDTLMDEKSQTDTESNGKSKKSSPRKRADRVGGVVLGS
jgi:hypothetical protein